MNDFLTIETPPNEGDTVLVIVSGRIVEAEFRRIEDDGTAYFHSEIIDDISCCGDIFYWMPRPKMPKETR